MAPTERRRLPAVSARLRGVLRGSDGRVRATWRVLLAMPLLWVFTGGVLAGNVQAAVPWLPEGGARFAGLTQSLLHAGFFLLVLAAWARWLALRPLSKYGVSLSWSWARDLWVGFAALVVGLVVWLGLGVVVGDVTVTASVSGPRGSLVAGLVVVAVTLSSHALVQQVVFFRVALGSAAEGVAARVPVQSVVVVGSLVVAVALFVSIHEVDAVLRLVDLVVAGTLFGLLYLHTGELALGTGVQTGALFAGMALFVPASSGGSGLILFEVTGSLPGVLGTLDGYGFPKVLVAYLLCLGWLRWRRGEVRVDVRVGRSAVDGKR